MAIGNRTDVIIKLVICQFYKNICSKIWFGELRTSVLIRGLMYKMLDRNTYRI